MTDLWGTVWKCPVCKAAMQREGNVLACTGTKRHAYDMASAGYVNLASAKASGGGDDADLIRARTAFLEKGHYAPIAAAVCEILGKQALGGIVLDAGCGEGYYTLQIAKTGMRALGIDLSKRGVLHAAKKAKREGVDAEFAVAGIFDLPVRDASLDAVVSLFAPVCEAEFLRVLKTGGILILVGAGAKHLFSLKKLLYKTPYLNEPRADLPQGMTLLTRHSVSYTMELDRATLQELFAMTPYYYRTSKEATARLAQAEALTVEADAEILVYQK